MARKRPGLNPQQERFLDEYLIHENGTRAYRTAYPEAGYQTAKSAASDLLAKPNVKEELAARRAARSKRTGITADATLREIQRYAFSDPLDLFHEDGVTPRTMREIPLELRRALASVKVRKEKTTRRTATVDGETVEIKESAEIVELKLWPKPDGLEKLCRHLGLAQEIPPLEAVLALLPAELARQVRAAIAGTLPPPRDRGGDGAEGDE